MTEQGFCLFVCLFCFLERSLFLNLTKWFCAQFNFEPCYSSSEALGGYVRVCPPPRSRLLVGLGMDINGSQRLNPDY